MNYGRTEGQKDRRNNRNAYIVLLRKHQFEERAVDGMIILK
jgi:hypothetical protein